MNLTDKQLKELLQKRNVISVKMGTKITAGVDTGVEAFVVGVEEKVSLARLRKEDVVPTSINDITTDVQVVKKIKALSAKVATKERTDEWIPAPGGVSCGPHNAEGTLGRWALRNRIYGISSCNHVLGDVNQNPLGTLILQPGPVSGGTAENAKARLIVLPLIDLIGPSECPIANTIVNRLNTAARLLRRKTRIPKPVREAGLNLVDCAWAEAIDDKFVDPEILEIGLPKGECEFEVGERVKKSGRSSGLTYGTVTSVDAAINVSMGNGEIAMFTDQIEIGTPGFLIPGDSGSDLLNMGDEVGGKGFAGSEDVSYANKYHHVKSALDLDTIAEGE